MLEERLYERYLPGYLESNSEEEKQRLWQQADPNTIYQLNSELQKLHGEGNDLISFSDSNRSHLPITAWPDMLSADIAFGASTNTGCCKVMTWSLQLTKTT